MLIMKSWRKVEKVAGVVVKSRSYRMILLFGIVPLFIWIDG